MILGVNPSHDAAFCLLDQSGQPRFILEEERFNRIKHSGFSTTLSLEMLVRDGLLDADAVTDIVYSFEMDPEIERDLMKKCYDNVKNDFGTAIFQEVSEYFHDPIHNYSPIQGLGLTTKFDDVTSNLRAMFPKAQETSYMHHLCHAASAFYPSGFESAAVLIVDGAGKLETITTWRANESGIEKIKQIELPHSLGIFYWLCSNFLGLEEGQTMGLAAYGRTIYRDLIYDRIIHVNDDGDFSFKLPLVFWFDMDHEYASGILENVFQAKVRSSADEPLNQFHADVAASLQCVTEEVMFRLATYARNITGEKHLCLAGGVVQNCVANGRLVNANVFENIWIQPLAHDAGTALGAALQHHYVVNRGGSSKRWRMKTAQLGRGSDPAEVKLCLERIKIPFRECTSPAKQAAVWIAEGRSVGWMQGRAEVGPRALGGRSILADPRQRFSHFALNEIKGRQPWRPFAPSVLSEDLHEYITSGSDSPFMILSFPVTEQSMGRVPAICHADNSARVQTVSKNGDTEYRLLIEQFKDRTGVPLILNTSFNQRSEPIVQYPLDAIRDFLVTGLDRLIIEKWAIDEKPVIDSFLLKALRATRFPSLYDYYLRDCGGTVLIDHEELTTEQRQRTQYLQTILDWLGIRYTTIQGSELASAVTSRHDGKLGFISVSTYLDEGSLHTLTADVLAAINVFILDEKMFMTQAPAASFLAQVERIRQEILKLANGRSALVWVEPHRFAEFHHCLKYLGLQVSGAISEKQFSPLKPDLPTHPRSFINGRSQEAFVIASHSVLDSFKRDLRKSGFRAGLDYIVFDC
jgi:carbamoyltransferase